MVKRVIAEETYVMTKVRRAETTVQNINIKPLTADSVKSAKDRQEWLYPNNKIIRAPSIELGSPDKRYFDPKDPELPRRKHESNLFITLNTNQTWNSNADNWMTNTCAEAVKEMSTDAVLCKYLKFGPVHEEFREDKYDDVIISADWEAAVEIGETNRMVHAHIWLTVHHYSQIQVNSPMMQATFKDMWNQRLGVNQQYKRIKRNPYIQVKLLPTANWAQVLKQYIHKGIRATNSAS